MNNTTSFYGQKIGDNEFRKLSQYIESEVGIKLPPIKRSLLESRLQKRLKVLHISSFKQYVDYVFNNPEGVDEVLSMIDAVTTNKTDFMREAAHFEYMVHTALPELAKSRTTINLWSAACSSGQEPYNMAMFMEEYNSRSRFISYKVTATDISESSLAKARRAVYQMKDIDVVSEAFKKKYFLRSRNASSTEVRIKPIIREKVRFQSINLMKENYGLDSKYDIVFCRNVLIYFNKENQSHVIKKISQHMNPGGYLFLGHSESLAGMREFLTAVGSSVYRKE